MRIPTFRFRIYTSNETLRTVVWLQRIVCMRQAVVVLPANNLAVTVMDDSHTREATSLIIS